MGMNVGLYSSNSDEWTTPPEIFEPLDRVFHFELDPCASHKNPRCTHYYTVAEDGLALPWLNGKGERCSVFMNPPYGRAVSDWMAKAVAEWEQGSMIAALVPARTDTQWFQDYAMQANCILFLKGRIRFLHPCCRCDNLTEWLYQWRERDRPPRPSRFEKPRPAALCQSCAADPPPGMILTGKHIRTTAPFPSCVAFFLRDYQAARWTRFMWHTFKDMGRLLSDLHKERWPE